MVADQGTLPLAQAIARQGHNPDAVLAEITAMKAMIEASGPILDSGSRSVTKTSVIQADASEQDLSISQTQKHQHCAVYAQQVGVAQLPDPVAKLGLRNSAHLVDHNARRCAEAVRVRRLDIETKQRQVRGVGRQGTDRDRIDQLKGLALNDHHRSGFSGVVRAAGNDPDVTALHRCSTTRPNQ